MGFVILDYIATTDDKVSYKIYYDIRLISVQVHKETVLIATRGWVFKLLLNFVMPVFYAIKRHCVA